MTPQATPEDVGRRLVAARLQRGLTQRELGQRAGLAASYLSRLETGRIHPTFRTVVRIAQALGAELEELVGPELRPEPHRGPCPVTPRGQCLIDLVRRQADREHYTPREVRLLKRFAAWIKHAPANRVRAIELLLEDPGDPPG